MKYFRFISLGVLALLAGCAAGDGPASDVAAGEPAPFEHFIRRDGARLYDGDQEFRFLSVNVPTLNYVEDEMAFEQANPYSLPNEYELRDVFATVNALGGQLVRSYTIPVRNKDFPAEAVTYVEAPGEFNETAFEAMDLVVALAGEYRVRLIIPLVNNWQWMGGRPNYADFRGKDEDAFCSDPEIIADYKKTIDHVLNRINTRTGIAYKDDPTIMAWETGNEMTCPPAWAVEIATYLKENAPKQLVVDGYHAVHTPSENEFVQPHSINHPAIDLVSTHHYEIDPIKILENIKKTVEIVDGKKPLFVGEFGFVSTAGLEPVMDYIVSEPDIAGGLIWSLRRHHRNGGWYYHSEPDLGVNYRAYHWPGFEDGEVYDERGVLNLLRRNAFKITGQEAPPIRAPAAPTLLPIDHVGAISWQGAMGAQDYTVERSPTGEGDWTPVMTGRDDMETPGFALFSDESAEIGETYYYRVLARNSGGISVPSNIVGPVTPTHLTRVDRARNFGTATLWKDVEVKSESWRSYKEATYRLSGKEGSELVYSANGTIKALRIYAFEKGGSPMLQLLGSKMAVRWAEVDSSVEEYPSSEANYDYLIPRKYTVTLPEGSDTDYIKIAFAGVSDLVRVEIDYVR